MGAADTERNAARRLVFQVTVQKLVMTNQLLIMIILNMINMADPWTPTNLFMITVPIMLNIIKTLC